MYTIKQAAELTGVSVPLLRAWERRYGVGATRRTESGYRLYDDESIRTLTAIRRLVDQGWPAGRAAASVLATSAPSGSAGTTAEGAAAKTSPGDAGSGDEPLPDDAAGLTSAFLDAARAMDDVMMARVLDQAFVRGSFEAAVDYWLMPTMREVGDAWARGELDVAAEHVASNAVMRRLSAVFDAAGQPGRGPLVVVGLPTGCRHELAALAFATGLRRFGARVSYLGVDVPVESWVRTVTAAAATAAVVGVPTGADITAALQTVEALRAAEPQLLIAVGGLGVDDKIAELALELPNRIAAAVRLLDRRLAYL